MDGLPEQAVTGSLRLLIIEDSEQDLELAVRRLRASGLVFDYRCVTNERDMHDALSAEMPNLILADFTLPSFDGLSALEIAREHAPDVPFIFLSGTMGEERAVEALKSGATDYIVKSNPTRLVAVVKRALAEADTRRRGRAAERQVTRLTRVLHMHSGINAALVRIRDRKELMVETCRLAHQVGGYAVAMVALIEPATRTARPVSWAGFEFLRQPNIDFPVADSEAGDTSLMGRVIRSGEAALCEDIEHPDFPIYRRTALAEGGVRSLACLPLIVDGTPIGSFLCGTMATGVISHDELMLLEEVASNLSFALQYLEKQEAVQFLSYFEPLTGLAKRALILRATRAPAVPWLRPAAEACDHGIRHRAPARRQRFSWASYRRSAAAMRGRPAQSAVSGHRTARAPRRRHLRLPRRIAGAGRPGDGAAASRRHRHVRPILRGRWPRNPAQDQMWRGHLSR